MWYIETMFSVLIANYNNSKFLKECIDSILNQSYKNWEIVFVDDCSSDNSLILINELKRKYNLGERLKIYKNDENRGCGYTKKRCIDLASGEICGFLDSDDVLAQDALELMVKNHEQYPEVSVIGSRRIFCDENLKVIKVAPKLKNRVKGFKSLLDTPFVITHFVSFKKSAYLKSPGIDITKKRAVDQDLYYKLEEQGKVGFIDKPLYYYRNNKNSISLNSNRYKADAWHLCIILEVCRRRNLNFDNYCSLMKRTYSRKEKIINSIFTPYDSIKNIIKNSISKKELFSKESEPLVIIGS